MARLREYGRERNRGKGRLQEQFGKKVRRGRTDGLEGGVKTEREAGGRTKRKLSSKGGERHGRKLIKV